MKRIVFIRHGKSSWKHHVKDIDRPLKARGVKDAKLIAKAFKNDTFMVDQVYSSPANRAYSTCKLITQYLQIPEHKITVIDDLYDFSGQSVIHFIQNLDNSIHNIMLFGHNHAFTALVNSLGNTYIDNLPTTGLVHIKFVTDNWKNITKGVTENILFPKSFR